MHNDKVFNGMSVVFDLDGTLLDTIGDIAAAMNQALGWRGYETAPVSAYRTRVGWGLRETVRRSLPVDDAQEDAIVAAIAQDFIEILRADPVAETVPYPGIPELLTDLSSAGVPMIVHTNKPDVIATTAVRTVLPGVPFIGILGQRDDKPRKPDPTWLLETLRDAGLSPDHCWYIGDSEVDVDTARAAGCVAVSVAWGYRDVSVLTQAGTDHVCYSIDELRQLLGLAGEGGTL